MPGAARSRRSPAALPTQGKILRLDVDRGHSGYAIPATNVFRGKPERRDEIYAWGFRNPFRLSFDRAGNGDLLVNGVAESLWETIYLVDRPVNYGWAVREGTHCFDRKRAFDPPKDCPRTDALGERLHDPVVEYANWSVMRPWSKVEAIPGGTANVGGFILSRQGAAGPLRQARVRRLQRRHRVLALTLNCTSPAWIGRNRSPVCDGVVKEPERRSSLAAWGALRLFEPLIGLDQRLHSLGEDADGELYLLTTAQGIPVGSSGKVWKLVPR